MTKKRSLICICVFALLAVPVWLIIITPQIERIPRNFSYHADIFSLDNFYAEEKMSFLGEQISKTHFSYEVISEKDDILTIKNIFDVHKITGEQIFAVERLYGIDAITGRHVKGHGDKDRSGFLFAPKHLKKQDYVYWHINYDEPASLKFKEEELIDGLKVYRYEAEYQADQTGNLGFLPGVPEERGVNLDINLQVWIEPTTGWLIQYKDKTSAFYYDINTKKRIFPWNKFSNNYTDVSVAEQLKIAKKMKNFYLIVEKIVPCVFMAIAMISGFLLLAQKNRRSFNSEYA